MTRCAGWPAEPGGGDPHSHQPGWSKGSPGEPCLTRDCGVQKTGSQFVYNIYLHCL